MNSTHMCFETNSDHVSKSLAAGGNRLMTYVIGISRRQLSGLNFERLSQRQFLQGS